MTSGDLIFTYKFSLIFLESDRLHCSEARSEVFVTVSNIHFYKSTDYVKFRWIQGSKSSKKKTPSEKLHKERNFSPEGSKHISKLIPIAIKSLIK